MLEPAGPQHLPGMWASIESSANELGEFLAWAIEPRKEGTRQFLERAVQAWDEGAEWSFAVMLDGRCIGGVGLNYYVPVAEHANLGYWIKTDHAGRGYTAEAASALAEWAFEELGLHRLELHAASHNHASLKVAAKLGFQREGLLREADYARGGWLDVVAFGLLRSDNRPVLHR